MSHFIELNGIANVAYMTAIFTNGKSENKRLLMQFFKKIDFTGYELAYTGN